MSSFILLLTFLCPISSPESVEYMEEEKVCGKEDNTMENINKQDLEVTQNITTESYEITRETRKRSVVIYQEINK